MAKTPAKAEAARINRIFDRKDASPALRHLKYPPSALASLMVGACSNVLTIQHANPNSHYGKNRKGQHTP